MKITSGQVAVVNAIPIAEVRPSVWMAVLLLNDRRVDLTWR